MGPYNKYFLWVFFYMSFMGVFLCVFKFIILIKMTKILTEQELNKKIEEI